MDTAAVIWAPVVVAAISMIGSVLICLIRAKYGVNDTHINGVEEVKYAKKKPGPVDPGDISGQSGSPTSRA